MAARIVENIWPGRAARKGPAKQEPPINTENLSSNDCATKRAIYSGARQSLGRLRQSCDEDHAEPLQNWRKAQEVLQSTAKVVAGRKWALDFRSRTLWADTWAYVTKAFAAECDDSKLPRVLLNSWGKISAALAAKNIDSSEIQEVCNRVAEEHFKMEHFCGKYRELCRLLPDDTSDSRRRIEIEFKDFKAHLREFFQTLPRENNDVYQKASADALQRLELWDPFGAALRGKEYDAINDGTGHSVKKASLNKGSLAARASVKSIGKLKKLAAKGDKGSLSSGNPDEPKDSEDSMSSSILTQGSMAGGYRIPGLNETPQFSGHLDSDHAALQDLHHRLRSTNWGKVGKAWRDGFLKRDPELGDGIGGDITSDCGSDRQGSSRAGKIGIAGTWSAGETCAGSSSSSCSSSNGSWVGSARKTAHEKLESDAYARTAESAETSSAGGSGVDGFSGASRDGHPIGALDRDGKTDKNIDDFGAVDSVWAKRSGGLPLNHGSRSMPSLHSDLADSSSRVFSEDSTNLEVIGVGWRPASAGSLVPGAGRDFRASPQKPVAGYPDMCPLPSIGVSCAPLHSRRNSSAGCSLNRTAPCRTLIQEDSFGVEEDNMRLWSYTFGEVSSLSRSELQDKLFGPADMGFSHCLAPDQAKATRERRAKKQRALNCRGSLELREKCSTQLSPIVMRPSLKAAPVSWPFVSPQWQSPPRAANREA